MKDPNEEKQHLSARIKEEVPVFVEQQFGHIEQEPPNKPSFLFVVLLSAGVFIVLLILGLVVLHLGNGKFGAHAFRRHPTSQLILPTPTPPTNSAVHLA